MMNPEELEFAGGDLLLDDEGYTLCCGADYINKTSHHGPDPRCAGCGAEVEVG